LRSTRTPRARHELALSYAHAIGATRAGVLDTTFDEETETDLFGEQVVLCGGLTALVTRRVRDAGRRGLPARVGLLRVPARAQADRRPDVRAGIAGMRYSISDTAEYGDLTRGSRVITETVKGEMKKILTEIQDGTFAAEWIQENEIGRPRYRER
jgi:ketol-acid reductoisomerase